MSRMFNYYNNSPFHLIDSIMQLPPLTESVYVISDSEYKELRKKQAVDEISTLQKRLQAYERTADSLRETINQLQMEHGLLPEASED